MLKKILKIISQHKIIAVIIILVIVSGGYFGYKAVKGKGGETRYVLAAVEKGTIITSVSGSGQVSVSNQADIKPKVSGEIVAVFAMPGQEIQDGTLLAQIDTSDTERAVRDAETSLETAKLELDKLLEPVDELTLLQAKNSLTQAKESKPKAENALKKAYEDGFNTVSNAFLDLPTVMAGLYDVLFGYSFSNNQQNIDYYANVVQTYDDKVLQYKDDASKTYQTARAAYDKNFNDYKSASRFSDTSVIESLINESYETTRDIAEAVKSANNLIQFYQDKLTERNLKPLSLSNTHLSTLKTYTGTTNSNLSSLLSSQQSIEDSKEAITSAEQSIEEKSLSFDKIEAGPDELDIRAKKIAIQQKEDALSTAKQALSDCYIHAPFGGVVAKVSVKKGDSVSSGTSLLTLVTKQKLAEISLNEIDVAKVKVGQKVTLTLDAVPDLSITGEVAEIDTIGTVSQGVVSYTVKITFDTQDERVKPGMSVSAAIITEAKQNVLLVSNSAVKSNGNTQYVEVLTGNTPQPQSVETGLSNDTMTEIVSGLKEGDKVVAQTITTTTSQSQSQQNTGFQIPGVTGGGGNFGR